MKIKMKIKKIKQNKNISNKQGLSNDAIKFNEEFSKLFQLKLNDRVNQSNIIARLGYKNVGTIVKELVDDFLNRMKIKNINWENKPKSTRITVLFCLLKNK